MTKHLTGFDEEVELGQLGEILENDSVVMSVEFADEERQATRPMGNSPTIGTSLRLGNSFSLMKASSRSPVGPSGSAAHAPQRRLFGSGEV